MSVTTIAGNHRQCGLKDGPGSCALFKSIRAIAADTEGNIHVIDDTSIRKIARDGVVTTTVHQSQIAAHRTCCICVSKQGEVFFASHNFLYKVVIEQGRGTLQQSPHLYHNITSIAVQGDVVLVCDSRGQYAVVMTAGRVYPASSWEEMICYPRDNVLTDHNRLYLSKPDLGVKTGNKYGRLINLIGFTILHGRAYFINIYDRWVIYRGDHTAYAGKYRGHLDGTIATAQFDRLTSITSNGDSLYVSERTCVRRIRLFDHWGPETHHMLSPSDKDAVRVSLMVWSRRTLFSTLPRDVLYLIFERLCEE